MNKVSIVIPCFNEELGIKKVLNSIPKKEIQKNYSLEIIVVDNNSTDQTAAIAKQLGATLTTETKQGKAHALSAGFRKAKGQIIVTLDGDNTYPPSEIPKLLNELNNFDLVVGSRFQPIWDITKLAQPKTLSFPRVIFNKLGALFASLLLSHKVTDLTSGMRVFPKSTIQKIPQIKATNLDFEAEFTSRVIHSKLKYQEVPISFNQRLGKSNLNFLPDVYRFTKAILRGLN